MESAQLKTAKVDATPRQELEILRTELRKAMWNYVGIIRNEDSLSRMLQEMNRWETKVDALNEQEFDARFCELRNMVIVARLITSAAQIRKESRGTHYRADYPLLDAQHQSHHICFRRQGKTTQISFAPSN